MNKIFLMQPRQSGKTSKAIYEYVKDPDNTLFVVCNNDLVKHIKRILRGDNENIISTHKFDIFIRGRKFKNIILDEYMFFKNKDEIYKLIQVLQPENLYIFSTPDKQYKKSVFDFVKKSKKLNISFTSLLKQYDKKLSDELLTEVYELYHNFLTDTDTNLIDSDYFLNVNDKRNIDGLINIVGKERFDLEFNNVYIFDDITQIKHNHIFNDLI